MNLCTMKLTLYKFLTIKGISTNNILFYECDRLFSLFLSLLGVDLHLVFSALVCLWTSLGLQSEIPPSERGSVTSNEVVVVLVVMVSSSPEWKEVMQ